ncbi:hypothetical protein B0H67DRAFT_588390 [Lasiosphaeris hirsuta]|uniref:Uncharacterized protein n=1 Tax=Lasiosphaeris hirsuta TaxID=260670 RepID=A0AA40A1P9_9PEZI|nr:hypothetical protein B0H67DRAFT_588390 [Lasiosphaeris hirsuta]
MAAVVTHAQSSAVRQGIGCCAWTLFGWLLQLAGVLWGVVSGCNGSFAEILIEPALGW